MIRKANGRLRNKLTNIKFIKPCHDWVDPNRDMTDDLQDLIRSWHATQQVQVARVIQ